MLCNPPKMKSCVDGKLSSVDDGEVLRSVSLILAQPLDLLRPLHLASANPPRLISEADCLEIDMLDLSRKRRAVLRIDKLGQLRRKPEMCVMSETIRSGSRRNLELRQVRGLTRAAGFKKEREEVDRPLYCRQLAGKILLDWRLRAVKQYGEASYWYLEPTWVCSTATATTMVSRLFVTI
jgi:hypothetical protein